jgi:hypothetical protein
VSAPLPTEHRTDRAIAVWFLVTIVALYGVIAWAMYAAVGAIF